MNTHVAGKPLCEEWREHFPLRLYEVSPDRRATVTTLMNLFQEAASHHAEHLGFGFSSLYPRHLGWMLSKLHLSLFRFPRYGETVTLRTWPRERKRIFAYRDVEFLVGEEPVGRGTSAWCVVDLKERKALSAENIFSYASRNERLFPGPIPSVRKVGTPQWEWRTAPRFLDLDMNGHVNNAVYLGWAVEALPREIPCNHLPARITFLFRKETSLEDEVCSLGEMPREGETLHRLENSRGEELARVAIGWEPRHPAPEGVF